MSALPLDRRRLIVGSLALLAVPAAWATEALPSEVQAAIEAVAGPGPAIEGGLTLTAPETAENGAFVPVTVQAVSAMRDDDRCLAIHLFATRNPTPDVGSYRFGPLAARAEVATRIRLQEGQLILAFARMADGTLRRAAARVAVTAGGCLT